MREHKRHALLAGEMDRPWAQDAVQGPKAELAQSCSLALPAAVPPSPVGLPWPRSHRGQELCYILHCAAQLHQTSNGLQEAGALPAQRTTQDTKVAKLQLSLTRWHQERRSQRIDGAESKAKAQDTVPDPVPVPDRGPRNCLSKSALACHSFPEAALWPTTGLVWTLATKRSPAPCPPLVPGMWLGQSTHLTHSLRAAVAALECPIRMLSCPTRKWTRRDLL